MKLINTESGCLVEQNHKTEVEICELKIRECKMPRRLWDFSLKQKASSGLIKDSQRKQWLTGN
jgi:hypothetical protein